MLKITKCLPRFVTYGPSVGMDLNSATPAVTRVGVLRFQLKQCFLWAYSSPDPHGDIF